jgi:class 3 adenylate cyclase/tetratricopeptide (TPR) repeat protein
MALGQYVDAFEANDIDMSLLQELDDQVLKEIGVNSVGHRLRIRRAISALEKTELNAATVPGERRHATVLFSDLSGYTAMNECLDPEDVRAIMARVKTEAVRIVEAFGGSVNQFVGDEVLALFGIPTAHKDDPVRAISAAIELHDYVRQISPEVEGKVGRPIRMHSGVATGLVVTHLSDDRDGRVGITGDTVNVGARLKSLADEDTVLVCPETQRAAQGSFELSASEDTRLKGKEHSITPYRVVRAVADSSTATFPFVGRRAELRQIGGAIDDCLENKAGQILIVSGEPGIGKTRLAREARHLASERGFECHSAEVLDFGGGSGADPVRSLVKSMLGLDRDSDERERQEVCRQCISDGRAEAQQEPFLLDLLNVPLPDRLRAKYDAMENEFRNQNKRETVATLLRSAAAERPRFFLIEDIHWADALTLTQLSAMAAVASECSALLILTTRTAEDSLGSLLSALDSGAAVSAIDLSPLRLDDARTLADTFGDVDAAAAERCIQRAGGHPLFLEQLLMNPDQIETGAVLGSIQSLVLTRVDQLHPRDKTLLQAASVFGQRFDPRAVGQLAGVPLPDFGTISSQGLIQLHEGGYKFVHALVRDGIYESLLHATRRDYHTRAAEWFSRRDPILYAEHLEAANDPGAAQAFLAAARAEAKALHLDRALRLVERGVALIEDPAKFCELLLEKGRLERELGQVKESISTFEKGVAAAQNDRDRCSSLIGIAEGMRLSDDFEPCLEILDQAQPLAESLARPALMAEIHYLRGCIFFGTGHVDACLDAYQKAKKRANQSGSIEIELRALGGLADGYYAVGRIRDGYEMLCECVTLAEQNGLFRIAAANRVAKGWSQHYLEGTAEALEELQLGLSQAREVGLWRSTWFGQSMLAIFYMLLCRLDEAATLLPELQAEFERMEAPRLVAMVNTALAYLFIYREDRQLAATYANRAREIYEATGGGHLIASVFGLIAQTSSNYEDALAALSRGEELLTKGATVHNHYDFRRHSIDTALRFQEWDDAIKFADRLDQFNLQERTPWADFFARRGRLLAAVGQGLRGAELVKEASETIALGERMGYLIALPELRVAAEELTQEKSAHEPA